MTPSCLPFTPWPAVIGFVCAMAAELKSGESVYAQMVSGGAAQVRTGVRMCECANVRTGRFISRCGMCPGADAALGATTKARKPFASCPAEPCWGGLAWVTVPSLAVLSSLSLPSTPCPPHVRRVPHAGAHCDRGGGPGLLRARRPPGKLGVVMHNEIQAFSGIHTARLGYESATFALGGHSWVLCHTTLHVRGEAHAGATHWKLARRTVCLPVLVAQWACTSAVGCPSLNVRRLVSAQALTGPYQCEPLRTWQEWHPCDPADAFVAAATKCFTLQVPWDRLFGKDKKPAEFGPFTPVAEIINGRAAMIGIALLILFEGAGPYAFFLN